MADAFSDLSDINSAFAALTTGALSQPGGILGSSADSVDSCLRDLAAALIFGRNRGMADDAIKKHFLNLIAAPFNEAANAFKTLFLPDPAALDNAEGFADQIDAYAASVRDALLNPIAAVLQAQSDIMQTSLENLGDILMNGSDKSTPGQGVVSVFKDTIIAQFSAELMDPTKGSLNMVSLLWTAVTDAIPNIELELSFLGTLKRLIRETTAEASKLPEDLQPKLPATMAALKLCEVEEHLKRVAADLRQTGVWNRTSFTSAKDGVCQAKDILATGTIPADFRGVLRSITGWDDRQLNQVLSGSFAPKIKFWYNLYRIRNAESAANGIDIPIIAFHRNLKDFLAQFRRLVSVRLGDLLALLIDVLRNQIAILRQRLEGEASGAADVFSQVGEQAAGYVVLYALCFLMERVEKFSRGIQAVLDGTDAFTKIVKDFIGYYSADDCGPDDGSSVIHTAVQDWLTAVGKRTSGEAVTDEALTRKSVAAIRTIESHEAFLTCIRSRLFFGKTELIETAQQIGQIIATAKMMLALYRQVATLRQAISNLDLLTLLGIERVEYNALGIIIEALQCLVANCSNPALTTLAEEANREFLSRLGTANGRRISVGSLDELPAKTRQSTVNRRIQAFFRLLAAIQRVTSLGAVDLCSVPATRTPITPTTRVTVTSDVLGDPATISENRSTADRDARILAEEAAAQPFARGGLT
jgi:hypothetical protein